MPTVPSAIVLNRPSTIPTTNGVRLSRWRRRQAYRKNARPIYFVPMIAYGLASEDRAIGSWAGRRVSGPTDKLAFAVRAGSRVCPKLCRETWSVPSVVILMSVLWSETVLAPNQRPQRKMASEQRGSLTSRRGVPTESRNENRTLHFAASLPAVSPRRTPERLSSEAVFQRTTEVVMDGYDRLQPDRRRRRPTIRSKR
jgi:hypothetical protein